jgi:outer membrane protein insertion porin family
LLWVLLVMSPAPAAAQQPPVAQPPAPAQPPAVLPPADSVAAMANMTVGRVSVAGNVSADTSRILRTFEVTTGTKYTEEAVRRGIRKLFALGLFADVWVGYAPHGDTMDLVIHVRERPRIGKIEFTGNRKKEKSDLEKKLFLRPGESYSPSAARTQVDSLLKYYHEEGYARAKIEATADTVSGGHEVTLTFGIQEGEKVKIERVDFVGDHAYQTATLRKKQKTKAHGFFGGGEVKEEEFTEDKERLEHWYHSNGYRDMRVVGQDLMPGSAPNRLVLRVTVDEGPIYDFGKVTWTGNRVVSTPELEHMWFWRGGRYDVSKIERARGSAYSEYAERGYLYVDIEPRETAHDNRVDLEFAVTEGRPSSVRYVNISGNKNTREKVIRRELYLREGDRVQASRLRRTKDNVSRLGLFEDVSVDFAPADSSDVDLLLKVKEKQVGTASAGAGFTNQSGVTGFLDLGHNNVNGSGQSLNLHLERGGKVEDYSLSFTEPWFRDTPTLLGFSLYNSTRDIDPYREKRVGGSVRVGRPLAWPDYSRGSLSYTLENVDVTPLSGVITTPTTPSVTSPSQNGITSIVEVGFLRLTTDNPFYPTRGTRLATTDDFAGGPFGGQINYHKHRYEGRIYFPSIVRGVTTMLRARVGLLGEYAGTIGRPPDYETFRLGGGTTADPLRGYDDYMVVPGKFIRIQPIVVDSTAFENIIHVVSPIDTIGFSKSRYPGGTTALAFTMEQQFPIVHPLHGVIFVDAGNTWDLWQEVKPFQLKIGAGAGLRMEIPLLGNIGFDYGYGFNRDDGPRAVGHFLIGNVVF